MENEDSAVKEWIKLYIECKVAKVQFIDHFIVGEFVNNRPNYTNEQVFSICLEILLEATKGLGLIEFLETSCELKTSEIARLEELRKSYFSPDGLKSCVYSIYREHAKNTEKIY